ncbi:LacI family DNA-binding transcriptional regulator [Sinomonas terrae]|uniref:LacI family transcriptional regulator n=1 Tax=Sinomonas terrae TaxID=2908838 RepID=A0ABS9TYJ0_9MICC|nr:LacI family DNA-binding transcriptional regulator [Sinomonas terrae]MCH6469483.1 LacI family transcriptional regulator [Sinomonas terrae]
MAALSGVAASTVSRALSQPGRVNHATVARVRAAAEELGYAHIARPRGLSSSRAGAVAVFVPDITNPFFFDFIHSTHHQLRTAGYAQMLVDTEEDVDLEAAYLEEFQGSAVGFILAATRLEDDQLVAAAARTPIVALNRDAEGVPSVMIATPEGVRQAAEHLLSLGHRDIAYIAGPPTSWSDQSRWAALEESAAVLGITMRRLGPYHPSRSSGPAAADALVNSGATACITFNDLLAIGILARLAERGIDVPGQMSVVGCDDIFGADFCSPPLTTLTSPIEQAGRVATDLLISRLRRPAGAQPRNRALLPTHLTIRSSTGQAPLRPVMTGQEGLAQRTG